jgi:hypothetical protein
VGQDVSGIVSEILDFVLWCQAETVWIEVIKFESGYLGYLSVINELCSLESAKLYVFQNKPKSFKLMYSIFNWIITLKRYYPTMI